MKKLLVILAFLWSVSAASAQDAKKLDDLLSQGWEPFSVLFSDSFRFEMDTQGNYNFKIEAPLRRDHDGNVSGEPAHEIFLRKKSGLAYCVRAFLTSDVPGFCQIIKSGQD